MFERALPRSHASYLTRNKHTYNQVWKLNSIHKHPQKMELPNILLGCRLFMFTFVDIHYYTQVWYSVILSLYSIVLLFHPILLKLQYTTFCYSLLPSTIPLKNKAKVGDCLWVQPGEVVPLDPWGFTVPIDAQLIF